MPTVDPSKKMAFPLPRIETQNSLAARQVGIVTHARTDLQQLSQWLVEQIERRVHALPSWLVSLVVHLTLFLILALWTLPQPGPGDNILLISAQGSGDGLEGGDGTELSGFELDNSQAGETTAQQSDSTDDLAANAATSASMAEELAAIADTVAPIESSELASNGAATTASLLDGAFGNGLSAGSEQGQRGQGNHAGDSGSGGQGGAEFFGARSEGRRFVFVVDRSNSMRGRRIEDAKRELLAAIKRLKKTQYFYVVFFSDRPLLMMEVDEEHAEEYPLQATPQNIRRLEKWLYNVDADYTATFPESSMRIAMRLRPDAIFFLTDGELSDNGNTELTLKAENLLMDPSDGYLPRSKINTIAFYSETGAQTLSRIASEHGGKFRFVPPPP